MNKQHGTTNPQIVNIYRQTRRERRDHPASALIGPRHSSTIAHVSRWAAGLLAAATVFLAGAPAALAARVPPAGGATGTRSDLPSILHPAIAGGTPAWQIVLVAVGSAVVASAVTLLAVRITRHETSPQPFRA